ncbi:hypothetical protein L1987_22211 [Smallanthus sonchifolius]|uniref:Uncharacterized protein n=1 Tax=Smallanthus sonchifolius TaxID=185202 RepID=A0ACB9IET6_9ASTR|nr:hypothetical protein L1987_22211 [Smallanthus sonchifolius]
MNFAKMATFLLNISSPAFTSKTNLLPHYKLSHKPFYSTPNISTKPFSSYNLVINKQYQNGPSASTASKEVVEVVNQVLHNNLRAEMMPKHVALIMERGRDLLPELGYSASRGSLVDVARICCELGIKVLSVYTCSSGKNKLKEEVDFTMNITKSDLEELSRNDIRVSVIGDRKAIPDSVLEIITQLEEATKNNKSLHIIETVNYTGYFDIIQSCIALAEKVKDGLLEPEEIDESVFEQELETKFSEFPNPDLIIRAGGKSNVGNFMLWQSAYSEICFVEKDALQFNKTDFIEVLDVYQKRNRRFGGSDKKKENE